MTATATTLADARVACYAAADHITWQGVRRRADIAEAAAAGERSLCARRVGGTASAPRDTVPVWPSPLAVCPPAPGYPVVVVPPSVGGVSVVSPGSVGVVVLFGVSTGLGLGFGFFLGPTSTYSFSGS